jgi:GAF domain-containing protein
MPLLKPSDVTLLELRDSVLCVECELISYNNTTRCLACGSSALMSLSRTLGGTLRGQQTTNLVSDEALGKIVYETLESIPMQPRELPQIAARNRYHQELQPATGFLSLPASNPVSAMRFVVERAFSLTRAHGAALALRQGNRMICQGNAGPTAPAIGSEVHTDSGLSGLCLRTGRAWRCDDAAADPNVNVEACRELGIRSVIAAPLHHLNKVMGILQVLSSEAFAFDDRDVATVQLLSQLMAMAFVHRSTRRVEPRLDTRMNLSFAADGASMR